MKIFTRVVMDWDGKILESESFDYDGPLALCGDAGLMGEGGGTAVAEGGGAPEPAPEPEPSPEPEPVEPSDLVPSEGGEEPIVEGAGSEGGEEPLEPVPAKEPAGREPLPAELAKSIKELKQAHPEQIPVLNALTKDHYTAKAFKQVYPTPDEAKADKVAIEALGGREGIAQMRKEVTSIEAFDKMASEGDPGVIHGLADQFPEGFKRLVPTAIERLAKSDPQAYRETLRGPLLQILEGDGLIGVIGEALDELKAGAAD